MNQMHSEVYFIPVSTRLPLRFGSETTVTVTCVRVKLTLPTEQGGTVEGWGETPLSAAWLWPSTLSYPEREARLKEFCRVVAASYASLTMDRHPLEIGYEFLNDTLPHSLERFNRGRREMERLPWLAALACFSPFDLAAHDAYAIRRGLGVYDTYRPPFLRHDLAWYFDDDERDRFTGRYPCEYLAPPPERLTVWHLVGGQDWLRPGDCTGDRPDDEYPYCLTDWIVRDGLRCLKIKLRGNDFEWDYRRLVEVGAIAIEYGVEWLSPDFNCMVEDIGYVVDILDRLARDHPSIYRILLYVEQPFPYDLERYRIDAHQLSARKPLVMDESAHGWRQVKAGRELGWTGVALKTCKSQTAAVLTLCWAREHGMAIMVQDLTNPMLAQISHVQLAAHAGTMKGVESNSMQFYPDASLPEARVHPGIYRRRDGCLCLESLGPVGFGYRVDAIDRRLPQPETFS